MSRNPLDYHINVNWNSRNQVYEANCVELPQCQIFHNDPKTAISEIIMKIEDLINNRLDRGIPLPRLSLKKCPCCYEHALSSDICSFCDYEPNSDPFSEKNDVS